MLELLLIVPATTALACGLLGWRKLMEWANVLGSLLTLLLGLWLAAEVLAKGSLFGLGGALYADALSALVVLIVSILGFASALYSVDYMGRELEEGSIDPRKHRLYYALLHTFIFTMLVVVLTNNLGVMWIAIEATTLVSAGMILLYTRQTSLEAAWKYIVICTVGILFALFGTILTYYSSVVAGVGSMEWTTLVRMAGRLDPELIKLSFLFILIGYGTKAGLAPMHTWLPDAHSEAPTPVSALLSGVLLKCSIYGILRYHILVAGRVDWAFSGKLLVAFGLLSMGVATAFILLQRDVKRLLAYSSVEHVGIIALGFGIGGWLGTFGALLHMLNHAVTKALMFFAAGSIAQRFGSKEMSRIEGGIRAMPLTGSVLLLGTFALVGTPPFSIFTGEFAILSAGVAGGRYLAVGLFLFFLSCIFAGFVYHIGHLALGAAPEGVEEGREGRWRLVSMALLLGLALLFGLFIPGALVELLGMGVTVLGVNP